MNRNWQDFKSLHSNDAGARDAFEKACETLFREHYKSENVQQVEVKQGDGGVDIFIGNFGIEPITVIQCKFFFNELKNTQHTQINKSFLKAKNASNFELKEWILAVPRTFVTEEHQWWGKWKQKKESDFSLNKNFIKLKSGNELIDLMKKYNIYNTIFQIEDSLLIKDTHKKITEIHTQYTKKTTPENLKFNDVKSVLFNNYRKEYENFYLEREIDEIFTTNVTIENIWIFGNSGVGKTALINRNLIQSKQKFTFCDLSSLKVICIDDIIKDIKYTLKVKYKVNEIITTNEIKALNSVLLEITKDNSDHIIVIDELSIDDTLFPDFVEMILQLINFFNNCNQHGSIKFIISSINEPNYLQKDKQKLIEYFSFINLKYWEEKEISDLLELLISKLELNIESKFIDIIVKSSNGSPRLLKKIIKKIILSFNIKKWTIGRAIEEAKQEYL